MKRGGLGDLGQRRYASCLLVLLFTPERVMYPLVDILVESCSVQFVLLSFNLLSCCHHTLSVCAFRVFFGGTGPYLLPGDRPVQPRPFHGVQRRCHGEKAIYWSVTLNNFVVFERAETVPAGRSPLCGREGWVRLTLRRGSKGRAFSTEFGLLVLVLLCRGGADRVGQPPFSVLEKRSRHVPGMYPLQEQCQPLDM